MPSKKQSLVEGLYALICKPMFCILMVYDGIFVYLISWTLGSNPTLMCLILDFVLTSRSSQGYKVIEVDDLHFVL